MVTSYLPGFRETRGPHDIRPHIALEVHQQTTAYMVAATNAGATFIADVIAEKLPAHKSMAYFKIDSPSAERTVFFHFKKHKRKSRVMQEFMSFITKNK